MSPLSLSPPPFFVSAEKRGGVLGRRRVRAIPGARDVLFSGDRIIRFLDAAAAGSGRGHPQVPYRCSARPVQGEVEVHTRELAGCVYQWSFSGLVSVAPRLL